MSVRLGSPPSRNTRARWRCSIAGPIHDRARIICRGHAPNAMPKSRAFESAAAVVKGSRRRLRTSPASGALAVQRAWRCGFASEVPSRGARCASPPPMFCRAHADAHRVQRKSLHLRRCWPVPPQPPMRLVLLLCLRRPAAGHKRGGAAPTCGFQPLRADPVASTIAPRILSAPTRRTQIALQPIRTALRIRATGASGWPAMSGLTWSA
jgi:hypothetical protein